MPDCTDPACPHPKPHGHLSMADRVPNGEPINDAIAEMQRLNRTVNAEVTEEGDSNG